MQFQILIKIGRIIPIISINSVFSPPLRFGAFSSCFLMTSSTSLSATPLARNAASKLNHWYSSEK